MDFNRMDPWNQKLFRKLMIDPDSKIARGEL
jgi:hypothetical protein